MRRRDCEAHLGADAGWRGALNAGKGAPRFLRSSRGYKFERQPRGALELCWHERRWRKRGWIAIHLRDEAPGHFVDKLENLSAHVPDAQVVAIDIPIRRELCVEVGSFDDDVFAAS